MRPGACGGPGDGDCTPAWVSSAHELWGSQADAVPLLHLGLGCLRERTEQKGAPVLPGQEHWPWPGYSCQVAGSPRVAGDSERCLQGDVAA